MTDPTTALREVLALSNKERGAEENREYGVANDLYAELQVAAVNLVRDHGPALLSALEDAQWRPIETAPRDGTRVLLAIEWSDVPVVGKYSHGLWWADTEHHEVSCGAYCYGGSVSSDTNMKPTHWRPLPKSPAIDAAIAEGDQE